MDVCCLQGVVGVISKDAPDVLCHAAVRARSSAIMLVACTDQEELAQIAAWHGQQIQLLLAQVQPVHIPYTQFTLKFTALVV